MNETETFPKLYKFLIRIIQQFDSCRYRSCLKSVLKAISIAKWHEFEIFVRTAHSVRTIIGVRLYI